MARVQPGGNRPLLCASPPRGRQVKASPQKIIAQGTGVITLLSLICQILMDAAVLLPSLQWFARIGVPLGGIFMSAGFFTSMGPPTAQTPGPTVVLIHLGMVLLGLSVLTLGIGLLRKRV